MKDQNCGYCMRGELLDAFGIYICPLDVSDLILFKEQSHPGRCIVAYKDHVSELVNISDDERNRYFADIARAAKAIHAAFGPKKVNYGAYGDTGCHLHFHLVPKYDREDQSLSVNHKKACCAAAGSFIASSLVKSIPAVPVEDAGHHAYHQNAAGTGLGQGGVGVKVQIDLHRVIDPDQGGGGEHQGGQQSLPLAAGTSHSHIRALLICPG